METHNQLLSVSSSELTTTHDIPSILNENDIQESGFPREENEAHFAIPLTMATYDFAITSQSNVTLETENTKEIHNYLPSASTIKHATSSSSSPQPQVSPRDEQRKRKRVSRFTSIETNEKSAYNEVKEDIIKRITILSSFLYLLIVHLY